MITTAGGSSTNYVSRNSGDFPDNTGDWTIFSYFKYPTSVSPATNVVPLILWGGNTDYTDPYLFIGSGNGTDVLFVEVFDGVTTLDTASYTVADTNSHWYAVTYSATTHVITLIVDGVTIGTVTLNLNAITWSALFALADGNGTGDDCSIAYLRAWGRILTGSELTAEAASITAVITTDLLFDNLLQVSIDLTSHNNTLNQLVGVGTVTTDTTDPLLSIIAGPPTNTSPANALAITTESAIFQDNTLLGVPQETWYKCAATENTVWGILALFNITTDLLGVTVYDGLANANTDTSYMTVSESTLPLQFPTISGDTFYFKVNIDSGTPTTVILSLIKALSLTVPAGSIGINVDYSPEFCVFLDADTAYPIKFITPFTALADGGDILGNGRLILANNENHKPNLYDSFMNIVTEINLLNYGKVSANIVQSKFLLGKTGSLSTVFSHLATVDQTGTILADIATEEQPLLAIGVNPDFDVCYYVRSANNNEAVRQWDLVNNMALSDLVAGIANYRSTKDILVLEDGTIIVGYLKTTATKDYKILAYDDAGATLHTYDIGANNVFSDNRLATAINNLNEFWTWAKSSDGTQGRFLRIQISDGTFLTDVTQPLFTDGRSSVPLTFTPIRFGHPESCPFWISRVSVNDRSGIYYLTGTSPGLPTQRHDTLWIDASLGTSEDVKIP